MALGAVPSPALKALELSLAGAVSAHALLGRAVIAGLVAHGLFYIIAWWRAGGASDAAARLFEYQAHGVANLPGFLSLMALAVLLLSSHSYVRRVFYAVFYASHVLGTLGFYVLGVLHTTKVLYYGTPGSVLLAAELARRTLRHSRPTRLRCTRLGPNLARIDLPGETLWSSSASPDSVRVSTQAARSVHVALASPKMGLRTHPMTVVGPSGGDSVLYVRSTGQWTRALLGMADEGSGNEGSVVVTLDGPHETHVARECAALTSPSSALLIGGGTGIAPLLQLVHARALGPSSLASDGSPPLGRTHLILVSRQAADVDMLESLPPDEYLTDPLTVQVHYTGGSHSNADDVHARAKEALARRRPWAPVASTTLDKRVLATAGVTHIAAATGALVGFRASLELPAEPEWAARLAAACLLNSVALVLATVAAHACTLVYGWLNRSTWHRWRRLDLAEQPARDGSTPIELKELPHAENDAFDDFASVDLGVATAHDASEGTCDMCELLTVSGRPDVGQLVRDFKVSAEGSVVVGSAGPSVLVDAVAAACKQQGVRHLEAGFRVDSV